MSKRESVTAAVAAIRAQEDWLNRVGVVTGGKDKLSSDMTPHENAVMVLKMARAIRESAS